MAKPQSSAVELVVNNTATNPEAQNQVHFVLQAKGGAGKSFVSWVTMQYLQLNDAKVCGIDTDASNQTFKQFKSLNVEALQLSDDNLSIEPIRFDGMMERLLSEPTNFVVDTGSNTFLPFWKYMVENEALSMLKEAGKRVYLHVVVTGGQALTDTMNGLDHVARYAEDQHVVVWLNEYFGKVESKTEEGTKQFGDMKVFKNNEAKILGVVCIKKVSAETFGVDIAAVTTKKLTFKEAIASSDFSLMAKQRLKTTQNDWYSQLSALGL